MNSNKPSTTNDIVLKNIKFWIADILKLFQEPLSVITKTEASSKETFCVKDDVTSRIKTLSIVGVVVGLRNEKNDCCTEENDSSIDTLEINRPIVYGKQLLFE